MKFARLGAKGQEKPAVMVSESEAVFVDHLISDWNRSELEAGAIAKVGAADLSSLPKVKVSDYRIGSPVARPTNIICVGLNYAKQLRKACCRIRDDATARAGDLYQSARYCDWSKR